ncbi:MAG TPA: nucleotidyltransferase domain-containing protein, partial [Symbiobacteriaceae bacterium]|nr:nucleotidyltransferase domain-containing protein [Symbiobacteriaceae bacterium]
MAGFGWDKAPDVIRHQVKRFVRDVRAILGEHLVGIYLHGSLAMGCFNPDTSDIDLLVVVRRPMSAETKRLMAGLLLTQSEDPRPLEVSFLLQEELRHWRQPMPYDLHYSEVWRDRFEANLARLDWEYWGHTEHTDPDLAAHVVILHERGIVLFGPSVRSVFPPVPPADYAAA